MELNHRFEHHPPSNENVSLQHEMVREQCRKIADFMFKLLPPSREASLAITKLEEAMFWANASIARNQEVRADGSTSS